jgi:hypothetical protein
MTSLTTKTELSLLFKPLSSLNRFKLPRTEPAIGGARLSYVAAVRRRTRAEGPVERVGTVVGARSQGLTVTCHLLNTPTAADRPRWDPHLTPPCRSKPPLSFTHQSRWAASPESGAMTPPRRPNVAASFRGISPHRPFSCWRPRLDPSDTLSLHSIKVVVPRFNGHSFMKGLLTHAPRWWTWSIAACTWSTHFPIENNSFNSENTWTSVFLQKHPKTFLKIYFSPYNFTFRSLFNFL